jgi:hypothetical protein
MDYVKTMHNGLAKIIIFAGYVLLTTGVVIVWNSDDVSGLRSVYESLNVSESTSYNSQTKPPPQPSVKISKDGKTCWLFVPSDSVSGVQAIDGSGKKFRINKGDYIEMELSGKANIGRGDVGPEGELGYGDRSVDSPFFDHVGGLEFSIGSLSTNRYLASINTRFQSRYTGVPVFRVIETRRGYLDGNSGGFTVRITKK